MFFRKNLFFLLKLLGIIAALIFFYRIRAVFFPFILAGFLAYLLHWPVDLLEKWGIKRGFGIILLYLVLGFIIFLIAKFLLPSFVRQVNDLLVVLPGYLNQVQAFLDRQQEGIDRGTLPPEIKKSLMTQIDTLEKSLAQMLKSILSALWGVSSRLFDFLLAPILAYYILKDVHKLKKGFLSYLPPHLQDEALIFLRVCDNVFGRFIKGHLLICLAVGIVTGLVLYLLKMPYSFLLGLLAGVMELIPYFGPILASIPILAIALLKGKILFFKTLVAIVLIQQLEGNVLAPKILGDSLGLHPLTVIFLLLSGFTLGGVAGMILAVPVAATARNLYILFRRRGITTKN
ncbi:AI-2E family transporter [Carboxydothermus pertinax]|uniref:AI-2E family transporter n=1 Tax=Carboxydothermus pertinax TaxID=870242 RepID=A0A1L8CU66_9THEO|nr:AI-2E family transporter [Carboxydothermus pertinax]GAV22442.1 AI-2E family transporter [Carboxydothermus pertinax]